MWDFVMDKSGAVAGFPPRTSVSPANLHSICFSTIILTITRGWHNRPGVAAVPIASQTKPTNKQNKNNSSSRPLSSVINCLILATAVPADSEIRSKSLWQWYINTNIMFLDIIHRPAFI
jgi:hypothetical protein